MRSLVLIGLLLVLGGVSALAVPYISYTEKERIVDVGPIQIDKEETKRFPISQLAAIAGIIAGLGLVIAGRRSAV